MATLDLPVVATFCDLAVEALGAAREEVDALNVYPVPDGDTGTNMFMTLEAARNALREAVPDPLDGNLRVALAAFGRGALLGARGNSGVILAQLLGALGRRLVSAGPDDRSAEVVADGLRLAADAAYDAVARPVEGTILSVARAAADAAGARAQDPEARLHHVMTAAAEAARAALARTPDQLEVLRRAGVVDAGGRGLCVVLDAAETALTGRRPVKPETRFGARSVPMPVLAGEDLEAGGPAYEVMYLLDADDDRVPELRQALDQQGDSLVVVGGEGLWNVHVHVDDVGPAIEAALEVGRPRRIRVTHFAEQAAAAAAKRGTRRGRRIVTVAAGPGLRELFASAGADVIDGGPGRRPAVSDFVTAALQGSAAEVLLLPNDGDSLAVAEIAARTIESEADVRVSVVPSSTQLQGIAALAVHEPGRPLEADLVEMASAARHVRHGGVTVAARQAMTSGGPCEPGDPLGIVAGDFALVGDPRDGLEPTALAVLDRLLGAGGEMVTLVSGEDGAALAEVCADHVRRHHATLDVVVYDGGQPRYPLLIGVE